MKKFIISTMMLSMSSLVAQSTMCYIENISNPAQAEITPLQGGLCLGKKTSIEMQQQGWIIDDIKLTIHEKGTNYTFIFQKNLTSSTSSLSEEELTQKIINKIKSQRQKENEEKKIEQQIAKKKKIKTLYISKCQPCHGIKGELSAKGTSRPLNTLSVKQMKDSILGYSMENYDRGLAIIMIPFLPFATEDNLIEIHNYLKTLN